ncbi:hypothetical protein NQL31_001955 [Lotmaria passim]
MGCRGSKERIPRQGGASAPESSSRYKVVPGKSGETASNGAASASPGFVDDGDPLERPTSSTSPRAVTPMRSHRSRGSSAFGDWGGTPPHREVDEEKKEKSGKRIVRGAVHSEGHQADSCGSSPAPRGTGVETLHLAASAGPATPGRSSVRDRPSSSESTRSMRAMQDASTAEGERLAAAPSSANAHPASADSTSIAAPSARALPQPIVVPPPLLIASDAEPPSPLLLLLPPPLPLPSNSNESLGIAPSCPLTGVNGSRGPHSDSRGSAAGGEASAMPVRWELGNTTTTVNSVSPIHTVTSTQPPSMQASRTASVQPVLLPMSPAASSRDIGTAASTLTTPVVCETALPPARARQSRRGHEDEGPTTQNTVGVHDSSSGRASPQSSSQSGAGSPSRLSPVVCLQPSSPREVAAEPIEALSTGTSQASPRRSKTPQASATAGSAIATAGASGEGRATISDEHSSTVDSRSCAATQSSCTTGRRSGEDEEHQEPHTQPQHCHQRRTSSPSSLSVSSLSPFPQPQSQSPRLSQVQHTRSASGAAVSPRFRTPMLPVSPKLSRTLVTARSASAMAADDGDAPNDLPLPEIHTFFAVSPMGSTAAHTPRPAAAAMGSSSSGGGGSGRVPTPRRQNSNSPGLRSPAAPPSMMLTDSVYLHSHSNSITAAATNTTAVSSAGPPALTSSFASHLQHHNRSNSSQNANNMNNCTSSLAPANSNLSWLVCSNLDSSGGGSSSGGGTGAAFPGTPPTNSELVRQINQPTTNIKSILRKRTSPVTATATATTTTHYGGATTTDNSEGSTMTGPAALGASAAHSCTLSLSLTNTAGGGASSPRLMLNDSRNSAVASSPPDAALRTDFISTRQPNSDIETTSPLRPHLLGASPPFGGHVASPQTPPGSFGVNSGVAVAPSTALSNSGEASLNVTATSAGNAASAGMMHDGSPAAEAEKGSQGQSERVGGRQSLSSSQPAAQRSPGTPGDASEGTAPGVLGHTSDEPPPDIMLAVPPKRVHVVI